MNNQSQIAAAAAKDPENFALANCLRALAIDAEHGQFRASGRPDGHGGCGDNALSQTPEI